MDSIITYLLISNQCLIKTIYQLIGFIAPHIPLKQMQFDASYSPKYQKFKVDKLPIIKHFEQVDYIFLLAYYKYKYNKTIKPVQRRNGKTISHKIVCPKGGATHEYIYDNNGGKGQYQCKVCGTTFKESNFVTKPLVLKCPYCGSTLTERKERKHFKIHKCTNDKCSYYLANLKKLDKDISHAEKSKYKLRYIYREFTINFFKMDLYSLPECATGFSFKKFSPHIMGLCLTYHVNLKLSTRQTAHALKEVHGIDISHTMVANYALTAAAVIKPFVDACKKSILGYQVSDTRSVGPCILAMRMAFDKFKNFPNKTLKFIADGYSAYPLAKQQFELEEEKIFDLTHVTGSL